MNDEKRRIMQIMVSLAIFKDENMAREFMEAIKEKHSENFRLIHVTSFNAFVAMVPIESFYKVAPQALLILSSFVETLRMQHKKTKNSLPFISQTEHDKIIETANRIVYETMNKNSSQDDFIA